MAFAGQIMSDIKKGQGEAEAPAPAPAAKDEGKPARRNNWKTSQVTETFPNGSPPDYSLVGEEGKEAVRKGLANGHWFVPHVERKTLRRLMQRDDWHATRDTVVLFGLILGSGYGAFHFWQQGSYWLFALCFWVYCTLYTSSGDSRWHECGHATAFKSKWKNDVLYQLASFMVFREPLVWRFSHARHHTDTDIVGRDPEIDGRPLDMWNLFLAFFNYQGIQGESKKIWMHAWGNLSPAERVFVPSTYRSAVYNQARSWLVVYALTVGVSIAWRTPLPAMYIFLPYSLGAWHFVLTGVFQHASLQHDVLDHRLNTRTCYINPISAFIYWNMHYHVEHHMFPMVPYYNLPELHEVLKPQMPKPYGSMWEVYCEMIPAMIKQAQDPNYYTDRSAAIPPPLPAPEGKEQAAAAQPDKEGWVAACTTDEVPKGDMIRLDVGVKTYCVYHAEDDGQFYATAGRCTHGAADLADGLVHTEGNLIECPKHNGCFDFKTGEPKRLPVRTRLATFPTKVEGDTVFVQVTDGKHVQIRYDAEDS